MISLFQLRERTKYIVTFEWVATTTEAGVKPFLLLFASIFDRKTFLWNTWMWEKKPSSGQQQLNKWFSSILLYIIVYYLFSLRIFSLSMMLFYNTQNNAFSFSGLATVLEWSCLMRNAHTQSTKNRRLHWNENISKEKEEKKISRKWRKRTKEKNDQQK